MRRSDALPLLLLGLVTAVLAVHAADYFPFFSDDALISLRYAKRFCEGRGLTWTDGERVEGYTDLLWILLNVPAACLHADPMWSARALDFTGVLLAVWIVAVSPEGRHRPSAIRASSGSILLALSAPVAVWAIGGLEHGFMAGVLALALWFARREGSNCDTALASLCFGLLSLLRADGVVLFVSATAGRWLFRQSHGGHREMLSWISFPVAFLAAQLTFRIFYYHEWIPNTAVAKVSFSWHRVRQGIGYLELGYAPLAVLVGAALFGIALSWRRASRRRIAIPAAVALGWPAYVALVGGDIFPGWRQLLFGMVPLGFLVSDGAEYMMERVSLAQGVATTVTWGLALAIHVRAQFQDAENQRAKNELWEWDGKPLGIVLRRAFALQKPLMAVDAAGALPYWSELPSLDMLGLNDKYIPRHPPPHFGYGTIGHELGDPDYVWQQRPDLIAFCGARGAITPCFVAGQGLLARPEFHDTYQLVHIQGGPSGPVGELYVNREGGKLGVLRTDSTVVVPSYLFAQGRAVASLDARSRLTTLAEVAQPGHIENLWLPAGTWALHVPSVEGVDISFTCDRVSPRHAATGGPVLRLAVATSIDIVIAPRSGGLELGDVTLSHEDMAIPEWECDQMTGSAPVHRMLSDFARAPDEGAYWAEPSAVRFGQNGLRVSLPRVLYATNLAISADGNDHYDIEFLKRGKPVGRGVVPPGAPGIRTRNVDVPVEVGEEGTDELSIHARGDGAYSVAHIDIRE